MKDKIKNIAKKAVVPTLIVVGVSATGYLLHRAAILNSESMDPKQLEALEVIKDYVEK